MELVDSRKSDREQITSLMAKLDKMAESQLAANEDSMLLRGQLSDLMRLLKDKDDANCALQSKYDALLDQLKVSRKTLSTQKVKKVHPNKILN